MTSIARPPVPEPARFRRPGARDPRLLGGLVLVGASVALGSWAVTSASRTVEVYVARDVLTAGDAVGADHVSTAAVRVPADQLDHYLLAGELPEGARVSRTVGAGELVPRDALGPAESDLRPVGLAVTGALSDRVDDGSLVEVWFVPDSDARPDDAAPEAPRVLVEAATVDAVERAEGGLVGAGSATVHVLVPVDRLADVLAALASPGTVDVLPVSS
ncbi:hypothetical protein CLV28_2505 [Sediminihabitans luteus]|uniref:SAF domain-containing protein n=1 Tax=Sediminihabitans luteus TaxID=1138585 RepID=A0A2M9CDS8_9CELL|nr:hypothetical protein [Sediminihabitans luteus]PJJ70028.1 hypothetical protein CLV28_2505 [Sediminihabitans luteus]GIJ00188.1 hypothetical protein Slu03_25650 [Sediminihabitans luteus]